MTQHGCIDWRSVFGTPKPKLKPSKKHKAMECPDCEGTGGFRGCHRCDDRGSILVRIPD